MAVRRPRIKASANLMNSKRKAKINADSPVSGNVEETQKDATDDQNKGIKQEQVTKKLPPNNICALEKSSENNLEVKVNAGVESKNSLKLIESLENTSVPQKNCGRDSRERYSTSKYNEDRTEYLSVEADDQRIAQKDQPISPKNEFILLENQSVIPEVQTIVSEDQSVAEEEKPVALEPQEFAHYHENSIKNHVQGSKIVDEPGEQTSFKCPPNVGYNRSNSHNVGNQSTSGASGDEVFNSDIEENVIQIDLLKSSNSAICPASPMSPSKTISRQRIRATPIFGQRRNSFVSMCQSPYASDEGSDFPGITANRRERHYSASISQAANLNTTHRRERHYSASISQGLSNHHHMPHKYVPSMGRIRTESGCSTFSDSYAGSTKSRKTDDHHHHHHRNITRRDFEARFNKGVVPDKSLLKMFDLIYYNPVTNPMETKSNKVSINEEKSNVEALKSSTTDAEKLLNKESSTRTPAMPVPQLKLNANGELILDDQSLEIETTAEQEARKVLASSSLIFLDENTGMNGFYKKQKRTKEWPPEETVKFYRCLQTLGTDFSLMCQLFPNRTRRDIKLKFKKEERCNAALINKALLYPKIFNIDELKQQLEAEERERAEANRKWKEIKAQEAKNIRGKVTNNPNISAGARALLGGEIVYHNENITAEKIRRIKQRRPRKRKISGKNLSEKDGCSHDSEQDSLEPLKKRKSKRRDKKLKIENENANENGINMSQNIQYEPIKIENNVHEPSVSNEERQNTEHSELEKEITDLLQQNNPITERRASRNEKPYLNNNKISLPDEQIGDFKKINGFINLNNTTLALITEESPTLKVSVVENVEGENVEVMVEMMEERKEETSRQLPLMMEEGYEELQHQHRQHSASECDVDDSDMQQILCELAEGSLVLVSTLDPNNPDNVLNEIYMLDKNTGDLCENPLDIPDAIVQSILTVMS